MADDVTGVLELERSRLRALVERDMAVAEQIHAADYELITPHGTTRTKATYLSDVAAKRLQYLAFEPVSPITVQATSDLIVLRYIAYITQCRHRRRSRTASLAHRSLRET